MTEDWHHSADLPSGDEGSTVERDALMPTHDDLQHGPVGCPTAIAKNELVTPGSCYSSLRVIRLAFIASERLSCCISFRRKHPSFFIVIFAVILIATFTFAFAFAFTFVFAFAFALIATVIVIVIVIAIVAFTATLAANRTLPTLICANHSPL
ncbi:hypothetical protein GQ42DRAFT_155854 [Ramicandelaber brevisporus]|nr:hypothetical protein GQ42DRAFT_155854 [Ramicandelaber brevisporus]